MTEERLKEIKDSIYIAHHLNCDPAISMDFRDKEDLYNEVVRLKEIIDKANLFIETYLNNVDDIDVNMQVVKDILKKTT